MKTSLFVHAAMSLRKWVSRPWPNLVWMTASVLVMTSPADADPEVAPPPHPVGVLRVFHPGIQLDEYGESWEVACSRDGSTVTFVDGVLRRATQWDIRTGHEIARYDEGRLPKNADRSWLHLMEDGRTLFSSGPQASLNVYDLVSRKKLWSQEYGWCIARSMDDGFVAQNGRETEEKKEFVYVKRGEEKVFKASRSASLNTLQSLPELKSVAYLEWRTKPDAVTIQNVESGKIRTVKLEGISLDGNGPDTLRVSEDASHIAINKRGYSSQTTNGVTVEFHPFLSIHDGTTGKRLYAAHKPEIVSPIEFLPASTYASYISRGNLILLDFAMGEEIWKFPLGPVKEAHLAQCNRKGYLVTAGDDGRVMVLDPIKLIAPDLVATPQSLEVLWERLGSERPLDAFTAEILLRRNPGLADALAKQIEADDRKEVKAPDRLQEDLANALKGVSDEDFLIRERALDQLNQWVKKLPRKILTDEVRGPILTQLKTDPSPEARLRLQRIASLLNKRLTSPIDTELTVLRIYRARSILRALKSRG